MVLFFHRHVIVCLCLWSVNIGAASHAATYEVDDDILGEIRHYTIKKGDSFPAIAHQFDIGIVELLAANPNVNPKKPIAGETITITSSHILPSVQREGIVLNLSELRLFYFADDGSVMTFPVSIGKEGWETPTGVTYVARKRENPVWIPTASIREENPDLPAKVAAGPDNPLGAYAIDLEWPGYAIHGTNRPYSVGKRASHGCIRLYPKDIKALFGAVQLEDKVNIIDKPFKVGWKDNVLFLEVTPTQLQADAILYSRSSDPVNSADVRAAISVMDADVDWEKVEDVIKSHTGIPTIVGRRVDQE